MYLNNTMPVKRTGSYNVDGSQRASARQLARPAQGDLAEEGQAQEECQLSGPSHHQHHQHQKTLSLTKSANKLSDATGIPMRASCSESEATSFESSSEETNTSGGGGGLINVPLIPLKIILFSWYAAGACLLPYMTLHMKQLGLTMVEMTAVYAILPIIQLFGTPIAGFMADRTGNYKSVLLMTLSICIGTTLLIQYIVPARKARDPSLAAAGGAAASNGGAAAAEEEGQAEPLYMVTFWLYLVIRVFHQLAVGLSYVLLDTTTIVLAEQHKSSYGRQRFWAIMATGIFSPICGFVIDYLSSSKDEYGVQIHNYSPAFHFFNVLTALTLYMASSIDVKIAALPTNVWTNVRPLLRSANVWIFLFSVFIMGSCWGFLESFLFIHLQKLQAPNYLLGLTVTVGAFIGLPFLYGSEWFVNKIGAVQLLLLALTVYFVRLIGYSLLNDPWWCIPYELMEAFTLHLMWVATVRLAYQISPPGMLATLQAVVGGLNFGVGRGFGSLVGGSVLVLYGIRIAFRVIGCMALATAVLYAILHFFFLPPLESLDKKNKPAFGNKNNNRSSKGSSNNGSKRRRQTAKDIEADGNADETTSAAAAAS